jgi:SOS response regulatory protein OraA/RecX
MEVSFHPHARHKLKERGIKESTVKSIIEKPDEVVEGRFGRKIAQKSFGRYILRTIYEEQENNVLVITAYKAKSERYK